MSAYTYLEIATNNQNEAARAAKIVKAIATRLPAEGPKEIEQFISDIVVEGNSVKINDSYSLLSPTFRRLLPAIMRGLARNNFCHIFVDAWFTSTNCGYSAEFAGEITKTGTPISVFSEKNF